MQALAQTVIRNLNMIDQHSADLVRQKSMLSSLSAWLDDKVATLLPTQLMKQTMFKARMEADTKHAQGLFSPMLSPKLSDSKQ